MDIKLFSDLIEALSKVASGLKVLANLPQTEREKYRQVLDDTYQLIHTTLNMILFRINDMLRLSDESFLTEVKDLDNYTEWMETERKFRLCRSLRIAVSETEGLVQGLRAKASIKEWDTL